MCRIEPGVSKCCLAVFADRGLRHADSRVVFIRRALVATSLGTSILVASAQAFAQSRPKPPQGERAASTGSPLPTKANDPAKASSNAPASDDDQAAMLAYQK